MRGSGLAAGRVDGANVGSCSVAAAQLVRRDGAGHRRAGVLGKHSLAVGPAAYRRRQGMLDAGSGAATDASGAAFGGAWYS